MRPGARMFFENRGAANPTAADYAQNGMIAMWDGIENAGWGMHDASATGLKNLVSNGTLDISLSGNYTIGENCVTFSGGYGIADRYNFTGLGGATISVLASYASTGALNSNGWSFAGVQQRLAAYYERGSWFLAVTSAPPGISDSFLINTTYRYDFVWDAENNLLSVFKNGSLVGSASYQFSLGHPLNRFRMMAYGSNSDGNFGTFSGFVHNCMVYGRALTASESAANYAIDKERFGLT